MKSLIGRKVRLATTNSDMSVVSYSARIVKIDGANAWVEIPDRVRSLPFPPYNGKRYALFAITSLYFV